MRDGRVIKPMKRHLTTVAYASAYLLIVTLLAMLVATQLPMHIINPTDKALVEGHPALFRWDSIIYKSIVIDGYHHRPPVSSSVAFFPLYPLAISGIAWLMHLDVVTAGFVVSWLAFMGACPLLPLYSRQLGLTGLETQNVLRSLIAFPTAFIFAAYYSESLFLLLSLATFYLAYTKRWHLAAITAALAAICRVNGLFLLIPLLILAWQQRRQGERSLLPGLPALGSLLGFTGLATYFWYAFGNPLIFIQAQNVSHRQLSHPFSALVTNLDAIMSMWQSYGLLAAWPYLWELLCLLLLITACLWLYRRRLWPECAYLAINVSVVLLSGRLLSVGRFAVTLFPLFVMFGVWQERRPLLGQIAMLGGILWQAIMIVWFVHFIPPPP